MTYHVEGTIRGRMVELDQSVDLPEGSRVQVTLKREELSLEEKRRKLRELAKWGEKDPSFVAALEEVVRERDRVPPREVNFDVSP